VPVFLMLCVSPASFQMKFIGAHVRDVEAPAQPVDHRDQHCQRRQCCPATSPSTPAVHRRGPFANIVGLKTNLRAGQTMAELLADPNCRESFFSYNHLRDRLPGLGRSTLPERC